jgi:hypothetical protein
MILSEKDKLNLIDALNEWEQCVGCKEMSEQDAGLDDDRFIDMMTRLGSGENVQLESPIRLSVGNRSHKTADELKVKLPRHGESETVLFAKLIIAADTVGIWSDAGRVWGAASKFEDAAAAMGFDIGEVMGIIEHARNKVDGQCRV